MNLTLLSIVSIVGGFMLAAVAHAAVTAWKGRK